MDPVKEIHQTEILIAEVQSNDFKKQRNHKISRTCKWGKIQKFF